MNTEHAPVTYTLSPGDLAYIVDALLDAATEREQRSGHLNQRIAGHLEDLALALYDARADVLEVRP